MCTTNCDDCSVNGQGKCNVNMCKEEFGYISSSMTCAGERNFPSFYVNPWPREWKFPLINSNLLHCAEFSFALLNSLRRKSENFCPILISCQKSGLIQESLNYILTFMHQSLNSGYCHTFIFPHAHLCGIFVHQTFH